MQALVYWARQRGAFQRLFLRVTSGDRQSNLSCELCNPADRRGSHLLFHPHRCPAQIDLMPLREDPHHRQHAAPESGRHEVRRRERFTSAVIIHRRIRKDLDSRRGVDSRVAEFSLVGDIDSDAHVAELPDKSTSCQQHLFDTGFYRTQIGPRVTVPEIPERIQVFIRERIRATLRRGIIRQL